MRLALWLVGLTASLLINASASQGAWVGVFLYRDIFADHVHVSVADHRNFNHAAELNIWNNQAVISVNMASELEQASKWILFWHPASKAEIASTWQQLYTDLAVTRSLLSKNCAYATRKLLAEGLGVFLAPKPVFSRFFLFVWTYHTSGFVPLPGTVYKQILAGLEDQQIIHYTKNDAVKPKAFLKNLTIP